MLVAQLCLTLCDPVDYSPPGSSVRGILQAMILKWVAMPFSRGFFWSRNQTCVSLWLLNCRQKRLPTSVSWPGEFHGLNRPWGHKDLDRTEWLSLSLSVPLSQPKRKELYIFSWKKDWKHKTFASTLSEKDENFHRIFS